MFVKNRRYTCLVDCMQASPVPGGTSEQEWVYVAQYETIQVVGDPEGGFVEIVLEDGTHAWLETDEFDYFELEVD